MNFSIAATTRRLFAPRHELSMTRWTWAALVAALRNRGRGTRESGAFLLGYAGEPRHVADFIAYDDLDPHCLDSGIVRFDGRFYGELWRQCKERELEVVADVHTHPGGVFQSPADQRHPMIAQRGHVALILPRFAAEDITVGEIGIYRYLGDRSWFDVPLAERRRFLFLSLW